jgi:hypothetical protein
MVSSRCGILSNASYGKLAIDGASSACASASRFYPSAILWFVDSVTYAHTALWVARKATRHIGAPSSESASFIGVVSAYRMCFISSVVSSSGANVS